VEKFPGVPVIAIGTPGYMGRLANSPAEKLPGIAIVSGDDGLDQRGEAKQESGYQQGQTSILWPFEILTFKNEAVSRVLVN
jgi:hypothetical protein